MNFSANNWNFMFSKVFPIENPIVNGIGWRYLKLRAIIICLWEVYILTQQKITDRSPTLAYGEKWDTLMCTQHCADNKGCQRVCQAYYHR